MSHATSVHPRRTVTATSIAGQTDRRATLMFSFSYRQKRMRRATPSPAKCSTCCWRALPTARAGLEAAWKTNRATAVLRAAFLLSKRPSIPSASVDVREADFEVVAPERDEPAFP